MESKLFIVSNPHYQKDGTKSYTSLMRKYCFHPTKAGPYSIGRTIHQTGRPFSNKPVGGRVRFHDVMQKCLPDNHIKPVEPHDIQQDAPGFVPVKVGTPPQALLLVLDTASTDFWVRSTGLPQNGERHVFDPAKSSTFNSVESATWKLAYVDGSSASGFIGTDNVSLGGMVLKGQHIELADMLSTGFQDISADGLLGLSPGKISSTHADVQSPVGKIETQTDLQPDARLFTVKLGASGRSDDSRPFCTFGYIDHDIISKYDQQIHYATVQDCQPYWVVESASAVIGENTIDRPMNKGIVDTAAGLTLLDDHLCQAIYDKIPGAFYDVDRQGYVFPSNVAREQRPHIHLEIAGKLIPTARENLAFAAAAPGYVYGSIQSRGSMDVDVLGDAFLDSIYAIFDVDNLRFGLVQLTETE